MIQKLETRLPINEIKIPSEICSSKTNILSKKKKESLNVTNNFNFQFSKKKNLIPSIARDTTNPNPFTNFPNILLLSFPPLSRYFTFLTLKPRLNINPLYIPIDDGRKTSVASIVPPLLRVSNFLYPANVIAG